MASAAHKTPQAARARRLLALLRHLAPDSAIPVSRLAENLGVSERELASDLETLSLCAADQYDPLTNIPLYVEDGVVHVMGPIPTLDRAVRLTPAEARALVAALQAAGRGADEPLLASLLAVSADADAGEFEQTIRAAVSPDAGPYAVLAAAAADRECVCIEYQGHADDIQRARTIEPIALQSERGTWYVHAFCREAGALRTFRLDRIHHAEPTGEHFAPHRYDPSGTVLPAGELPRAVIAFAPGVPLPLREWPGSRILPDGQPGALLEVPYAGTAWIARQVAAYLGDATVIEPFEVREAVAVFVAHEMLQRPLAPTHCQTSR